MKAVIYARVSSTDDSQSYERQIEDLSSFAKYQKLIVCETFAEKISGFSKGLDERKEFNSMMEYIEKNGIRHILVSEISRISRRYIDTVNFISDCTKKGITVHIHKEGFSTIDQDGKENSTAQMVIGVLSNMANQESKSLSYRIKSGKNYAAKNGGDFNNKIYGYSKGVDKRPLINEAEAVLVRKIFEMLVQGIGIRTITNYLNTNFEGREWKKGSIHSMVRNSFYCGKRKYLNEIITVPAIVSEDVFNAAQDFIDNRKRFAGRVGAHVNPFASFIKCKCGNTMNQIILHSNNTDIYRCAKRCGVQSVNRPFLIREIKLIVEKNAKLTQDENQRHLMNEKIRVNTSNILVNEKEIRKTKMKSEKNYERLLENKIDEEKYDEFELKFKLQLTKLEKDNEELSISNEALKTHLKGEIMHYSDDLSVFKSQLLKTIDFIEIHQEIAVIKIKGWAKVFTVIHRETTLFLYNRYIKANGTSDGFTALDWEKLPEANFTEEV